jgi:uncharacterized membrane protein YeaQ/YmgE (transglycosylase-associated protein family)
MNNLVLPEVVHQWGHDILAWIGFGTLVGLAAKTLMPGRDQGGTVATLLMGIGGTVVGSGLLVLFGGGHRVSPLSLLGFVMATTGAFVILFFHRMLNGAFFREDGTGPATAAPARRGRKKVEVVEKKDLAA